MVMTSEREELENLRARNRVLQARVDELEEILTRAPRFNGLTPDKVEGLAILAEECAEVVKEVCKVLRHGPDSRNPDAPVTGRSTNIARLHCELGDVRAAMMLLARLEVLDLKLMPALAACKLRELSRWVRHIEVPLVLQPEDEGQEASKAGRPEAIVEAIRTICGEPTTWLEEIGEWSFPTAAHYTNDASVREALTYLLDWLDKNAPGPIT